MYQFQPQQLFNNDKVYQLSMVKQQDFTFTCTDQDLLLNSGYCIIPPSIASPSFSHYSKESYFSPIEQTSNFEFFPVVQQTSFYDYLSFNPIYPTTTNQYTTTSPMYTQSSNPLPLSSSSTSLCSTTSTISSYSSEEKKQTESKPYACPTCRRAFARKHDLQRHIRVHTGEKPYSCPCCNKAFARTDALKRHLRMEEQCRTSHQVQTMKDTGKRRYRNL